MIASGGGIFDPGRTVVVEIATGGPVVAIYLGAAETMDAADFHS